MKGFIEVSRATTCASVVILESRSPESVVAKRRDSVQKPYGMTFVWGGRTVKPILSSPKVVVRNLLLLKRKTTDFRLRHSEMTTKTTAITTPTTDFITLRTAKHYGMQRCIFYCCRFVGLKYNKNNVPPLIKRARKSAACKASAGFTLMELLVVVLIIGILAGVALPQYETAVLKSKMNSIVPLVRAIKNANEVYYMANGKYTDNLNDLDISIPAGNANSKPWAGLVVYDNGTWIDQYVEGDCGGNMECPRVWGGFGRLNEAGNKWEQPNCVVAFYYDNTTTPGKIQCSGSHSKCAKICKGMNL